MDDKILLVRANLGEDPEQPATHILPDSILAIWLDEADGSTNRVTYKALVTIATNEVLVSKKIVTQDLSTDGPAVADALLKLGATYKAAADEEEAVAHFSGYVDPGHNIPLEAEERKRWGW